MINIYLDDKRVPSMSHNSDRGLGDHFSNSDKWVIVKDYFEFVDAIDKFAGNINIVSFDHDLACFKDGYEYTGKTATDYLINYCLDNNLKFPSWYVHSDNTSGKKNIIGAILNYLKVVEKLDISNFRYYHNGLINGLAV
jgi:hypothetical protein